jgi:hypothetical protein
VTGVSLSPSGRGLAGRAGPAWEAWGSRALVAGLMLWGIVPIVVIALHALVAHERLTGADGIVGADQLQYLAWARDAGEHGLAANLFELTPTGHVYLQPLFTITGLLWRLGLSLTAAYWLWKPVAVVVLFAGAGAWTNRLLAGHERERLAALALALFMLSPIGSLLVWVHIGPASFQSGVGTASVEMLPAAMLWGYLPSAIAVGLMPLALLACERALRAEQPAAVRRTLLIASAFGLLLAWLHPWQGVTLVLVLAGLALWEGQRGRKLLALPAIATALPLAYYELLSRYNSAWKLASHNEIVTRPEFAGLVAALAPLLAIAAFGARHRVTEPAERALLLWIPASLVTYFALDAFSSHALDGLSLPFAVLAVRGWRRLRVNVLLSAAAVALITIPGLLFEARQLHRVASSSVQEYYLNRSETRALSWVAHDAPPGGVLAPVLLALAIPSQTSRSVWVGHEFWSRDYAARLAVTNALFDGGLSPIQVRVLVALSGARLLVSSCAQNANLAPALGPALASVHRFGCSTVYVVRRP